MSDFGTFFQIQRMLNNQNVSVAAMLHQLQSDLSETQLRSLLTSGVRHLQDKMDPTNRIINDIFGSLSKININNQGQTTDVNTKQKQENSYFYCKKVLCIRNVKSEILSWLDCQSKSICSKLSVAWLIAAYDAGSQSSFDSKDFEGWDGGLRKHFAKSRNILGLGYSKKVVLHPWPFEMNVLLSQLVYFTKISSLTLLPYTQRARIYYNRDTYTHIVLRLLRKNCQNIDDLDVGINIFDKQSDTYNIIFPTLKKLAMTKVINYVQFGSCLRRLELCSMVIDDDFWNYLATTCDLKTLETIKFDKVDYNATNASNITHKLMPIIASKLAKLKYLTWLSIKAAVGAKSAFIEHVSKFATDLQSLQFNINNNNEFTGNYSYHFENIEHVSITINSSKLKNQQLHQIYCLLTTCTSTAENPAENIPFIDSIDTESRQENTPTNPEMPELVCRSLVLESGNKRYKKLAHCGYLEQILKQINSTRDASKLTKLKLDTSVPTATKSFCPFDQMIKLLKQIQRVKNIEHMAIDGLFNIYDDTFNWANNEKMAEIVKVMQNMFTLNAKLKISTEIQTSPCTMEAADYIKQMNGWFRQISPIIRSSLKCGSHVTEGGFPSPPGMLLSRHDFEHHTFLGTGLAQDIAVVFRTVTHYWDEFYTCITISNKKHRIRYQSIA